MERHRNPIQFERKPQNMDAAQPKTGFDLRNREVTGAQLDRLNELLFQAAKWGIPAIALFSLIANR